MIQKESQRTQRVLKHMLGIIDNVLDGITMYRLVLYELLLLLAIAILFAFFGMIAYPPLAILESALFLVGVAYSTNKVFASVYKAPTNVESVYITALILALIAKPMHSYHDLPFLGWLAVWSMASKYIFAYGKKHLFNPVAIAGVIVSLFLGQSFNWWVGTGWMAPSVLALGLLTVRKIQREDFVYSFFFAAVVTIGTFVMLRGGNIVSTMQTTFLNSSLLFFGFIMLTEPLTTPPTKKLQVVYGLFTGFLFAPQVHFGSFFLTPELALVVGNIFSYVVSPKQKLLLSLKEKIQVGLDQIDFIFISPQKFSFTSGQYMEWTLQHKHTDSRGNRRYFTIASSPTENEIHLGVKFYPNSSSYKKALVSFSPDDMIVAAQLSGDFTLPKDPRKKLVFLAGGIGITPFRSMAKFLIDTKANRDIILFYSNKVKSEIMYADVFEKATVQGIKTVYTLTDTSQVPSDWKGYTGRIMPEIIRKEVPDFMERTFYLSGPHGMVVGFDQTLKQMGIRSSHIKKDFFPGFV